MGHEKLHNLIDPDNHTPASGNLVPGASGQYDLGSSDTPWANGHLSDSLFINLDPSGINGEGRIYWDRGSHSLSVIPDVSGITLQIGLEDAIRGLNDSGIDFDKGDIVNLDGASGGVGTFELADTSSSDASYTVGVLKHDLSNGEEGLAIGLGYVRDIDTTGTSVGESWSAGDTVYLSPTGTGNLTNVRPADTEHLIIIGRILVADATQGILFVDVKNNWEVSNHILDTTDAHEISSISFSGTSTHIENLQDGINHMWSAASVDGFEPTVGASGTFTLTDGTVILRSGDDEDSPLVAYDITGGTTGDELPDLTDNATNFIYARYNSGSPEIAVTVNPTLIDGRTEIPIHIATRIGDTIYDTDLRRYTSDFMYKISRKDFYLNGYQHEPGGSVVTEVGDRNIDVTAGAFYLVGNRIPHDGLDTSASGVFTYYSTSDEGVTWTRTPGQQQIDNNLYNATASGLVALPSGYYSASWLYTILGDTTTYGALYCDCLSDNLATAEGTSVPSLLPPEFRPGGPGQLIAKIVVQQGTPGLQSIQTPFETVFNTSSAANHNNLGGIQGGTSGENYHLTADQFTYLDDHETDPNPHPQYTTADEVAASGYVVGPASSTDSAVALWDGNSGKLVQDSNVTVNTSPTGGSLLNLIPYTSQPTGTINGDLWLLDASGMYIQMNVGGTIYSVELT
jgi:hypothetical protein